MMFASMFERKAIGAMLRVAVLALSLAAGWLPLVAALAPRDALACCRNRGVHGCLIRAPRGSSTAAFDVLRKVCPAASARAVSPRLAVLAAPASVAATDTAASWDEVESQRVASTVAPRRPGRAPPVC